MKIRNGFVSNSSSSSFILNSEDLIDKFGEDWKEALFDKVNLLLKVYDEERSIENMLTISTDVEAIFLEAKEYGYNVKEEKSNFDVAINSRGDNSIPYYVQEYIESLPSVRRFHWG